MNGNFWGELMKNKGTILNLYNIRQEYWNYHKPEVDLREINPFVKLILGFILYMFLYNIYSDIYPSLPFKSPNISVIGLVMVIISTFLIYRFVEAGLTRWQVKKQLEKFSARITTIIEEEKQLEQVLSGCIIPERYRNPYAIGKFEDYMRNARADTLKECVNLLENERQHNEYMNQLRSIEDMQEDIHREASDAKYLSLYTIFTKR